MQLSFITDEFSQDARGAYEFARDSGLCHVEMRSAWGKHCLDFGRDEVSELLALGQQLGVGILVLDSFLFKCAWDEEPRSVQLERAKRYVALAHSLGASWLRVFAFWKGTTPGLAAIAERLSEVSDIAEQGGVSLLVENGTFSEVGEGSALSKLLRYIDRETVSALWDPGNTVNGGWSESIERGARALGARTAHVHVKNPHRALDGSLYFSSLRGGEVDWEAHLRLLDELGFTGTLSLETHFRSGRALAGRRALDFPTGEGFSAGGAEPTRQVLAELRALLCACASNGGAPARTSSKVGELSVANRRCAY